MIASDDAAQDFRGNPPAATFSIEQFPDTAFPQDYVDFLRRSNGGEGFLPNGAYAILYRLEELRSLNRDYEIEQNVPGLLLFGSNGGGEAYCFDLRTASGSVVQVPFVGMAFGTTLLIAQTFVSFMAGDWLNQQ